MKTDCSAAVTGSICRKSTCVCDDGYTSQNGTCEIPVDDPHKDGTMYKFVLRIFMENVSIFVPVVFRHI